MLSDQPTHGNSLLPYKILDKWSKKISTSFILKGFYRRLRQAVNTWPISWGLNRIQQRNMGRSIIEPILAHTSTSKGPTNRNQSRLLLQSQSTSSIVPVRIQMKTFLWLLNSFICPLKVSMSSQLINTGSYNFTMKLRLCWFFSLIPGYAVWALLPSK